HRSSRRRAGRWRECARGGLASGLLQRNRLLLFRYELLLAGIRDAVLGCLARLWIASRSRNNFDRGCAVCRNDRRRLHRARGPKVAAVGIGAGRPQHGTADKHERSRKPAPTLHARRVVVHRVFVRLERSLIMYIDFGRAVLVRSVARLRRILLLLGSPMGLI